MSQTPFEPPKVKQRYPRKCPICGGPIKESLVTLSFPDGDAGVKIIHEVPAGICGSCGEEYLAADVAAKLERILKSPPHHEVTSPVWKYAAGVQ